MYALLITVAFFALASAKDPYFLVKFSVERGFFTAPFSLKLSSPSDLPNATSIRYLVTKTPVLGAVEALQRVGAEEPVVLTPATGQLYNGAFTVDHTCYVRAIAYNATHSTNLTVHTYIFIADVLQTLWPAYLQSETPAKATRGLLAIPSLSMTSATFFVLDNMLNRTDYERPGWLEWLDPANPDDNWMSKMSYELYGGYSRFYPKKNWRIHFQTGGIKGEGELDFRLFKGFDTSAGASRVFKSIDLRGHSQDGPFDHNVFTALYMKNIWGDWSITDIPDQIAIHARMAHVYFNGYYMGLYHVRERIGEHFFRQYLGGHGDEWEGINSGRGQGGFTQTYAYLVNNAKFASLDPFVDWTSFLGFCILENYGSNQDLGGHNWQCGGQIAPKPRFNAVRNYGGWKFFASDNDVIFQVAAYSLPAIDPGHWVNKLGDPFGGQIFNNLLAEAHPEFMLKFQDHIYMFVQKKGGVFTDEKTLERFQRIYNTFDLDAVVPVDLMRWGYLCNVPGITYGFCHTIDIWRQHVSELWRDFITGRAGTFLNAYRDRGYLNTVGAPVFSLADRAIVKNGATFTISSATAGNLEIIYTTNGLDPRLPGGAVHANATVVKGNAANIIVMRPTLFTARVRLNGVTWGVIDKIHIFAREVLGDVNKCVMCGKVIFTEINYNHGKIANNQSEFVEVKNIGSEPVVMTGAVLSRKLRNNYTFPPLILQPGQFWVMGFFLEDFHDDYNKRYPDDMILFKLSESKNGDELTLFDQFDNIVNYVDFEADSFLWSKFADGRNFSLVARPESYAELAKINSETKDNLPFSRLWRQSTNPMGSPWNDDPLEPESRKVLVQFNFLSYEKTWIELTNPTKKDIDLTSWVFTDKPAADLDDDEHVFVIPAGTILAPGVTKKFKLGNFKMKRDKEIYLARRDPVTGYPTGNFIFFDANDNELAFK